MTVELHFLSHLRRGMPRLIGERADRAGIPQQDSGTVTISLQTADAEIDHSFEMLGPGSIIGLAGGEVLRLVPAANAQDHPSNLFPSVELKTPDLLWRYTPAQPNRENLIPWLVLVVVPERAGITLESGVPLAVLHVDEVTELPDLQEAWAWGHVQNGSAEDDLDRVLDETPDAIWARLLCPRALDPDTAYIACIVPSFEAGRLAGLGLPTTTATSSDLAWTAADDGAVLPVYYHWRFRTSPIAADFEELVRRLTPITLSPEVGVHPLDLSDPGSEHLPRAPVTVGFEGALVSPQLSVPPWRNPHRAEFQAALAKLLGRATPPAPPGPGETYDPLCHDPVLAPPGYGLLPAGLDDIPKPNQRPSRRAPRWLSESNLDARHRAVAGVGSEVVRRNQERLMAEAWDQALGITSVNRVLTHTRLALEVGRILHTRLQGLAEASVMQMTAGAHPRLPVDKNVTAYGSLRNSDLPKGTVSAAFRRHMRPGGTFAKALRTVSSPGDGTVDVSRRITERISTHTSTVLRYADLTVPYGAVLASEGATTTDPTRIDGLISRPTVPTDLSTLSAANLAQTETRLRRSRSKAGGRLRQRLEASKTKVVGTQSQSSLQQVTAPEPLVFAKSVVSQPGLVLDNRPFESVYGGIDHILTGSGTISPNVTSIDLHALASDITAQLEPTRVLAARIRHIINPAGALGSEPVPAFISPSPIISDPLYRDIVRIDPELLMPGVGELSDESVGLAAVNAPYVEAFLLGVNHEFARELLWREYPTDLTDTWLRTFWDHAAAGSTTDADIQPIAQWSRFALGAHSAAGTDPGRTLVLVIKGELLRRYPNTLISAVPARWNDEKGTIREEDPDAVVLSPAFVGNLARGVVFVGFEFDSTVDVERDVRGSPHPNDALPGWYFTFEEPPTEPGFGLDTAASDTSPALEFWKDLTWADARTSEDAKYVQLAAVDKTLPYDKRGANQWTETWADSAAAMARITLQRPVRMLVHADQMLDPDATA